MFSECKQFLKKHPDLIVIPADKGNSTVIMYRNDYQINHEKMLSILNDNTTYRKLTRDPTLKHEKHRNELMKKLDEYGIFQQQNRYLVTKHNIQPPGIYVLPKVHKTGTPLRAIVSCINAPSYDLAKWMTNILNHLSHDRYNVKNSYPLVDKIDQLEILDDEKIVSFDVVSLFPNIPTELAINTIMNRWEDIKDIAKIPKESFVDILKFILIDSTYFTFDNKYYQQLDGSAICCWIQY